jgi:hypothetical protein
VPILVTVLVPAGVAGHLPVDHLTTGRLAFLGMALTAIQVVGGLRETLGMGAAGPLLAVGTVLLTPLVMIGVGRLARQRAEAEEALRHHPGAG